MPNDSYFSEGFKPPTSNAHFYSIMYYYNYSALFPGHCWSSVMRCTFSCARDNAAWKSVGTQDMVSRSRCHGRT